MLSERYFGKRSRMSVKSCRVTSQSNNVQVLNEDVIGVPSDAEEEQDEATEDVDATGFANIKNEIETFHRRLREEPKNIELWLQWVEFQPQLLNYQNKTPENQIAPQKKSTRDTITDLKLAILDKALERNPASVELHLRKLVLIEGTVEKEVLLKQWKALLFQFPHRCDLWKSYLDYRATHVHHFTVSSCLKAYAKCFDTLRGIQSGQIVSHRLADDGEQQMIGCQLAHV